MAVRDDFAAGEVLAAADLNDTFASKLPYSYGTATPSTTDSGFLWYDSNSTPAAPKFWDGAAFQALTSGKILQIVRATDNTQRTTTSTSYVDVTGMTVTITPHKSDSAVLIVATFVARNTSTTGSNLDIQVTDASNNPISGVDAANVTAGALLAVQTTVIAYATPATTSATTYKMRFKSGSGQTVEFRNDANIGQIYAIEVSA